MANVTFEAYTGSYQSPITLREPDWGEEITPQTNLKVHVAANGAKHVNIRRLIYRFGLTWSFITDAEVANLRTEVTRSGLQWLRYTDVDGETYKLVCSEDDFVVTRAGHCDYYALTLDCEGERL